jgi:hypothetical protein
MTPPELTASVFAFQALMWCPSPADAVHIEEAQPLDLPFTDRKKSDLLIRRPRSDRRNRLQLALAGVRRAQGDEYIGDEGIAEVASEESLPMVLSPDPY